MTDCVDQDAVLGFARNNRGPVFAALQEAVPIGEGDVPILQFLVMATEASLLENRSNLLVEEL